MFYLFFIKLVTVFRLGLLNVLRAVVYRFGLFMRLNPVRRLRAKAPLSPFFLECCDVSRSSLLVAPDLGEPFGVTSPLCFPLNTPPDWHYNVLTGRHSDADSPWWMLPDFAEGLGDIKGVWEASRFDWVLTFAQRTVSGDAAALGVLNDWLKDWCDKNTPYLGANWKCGQEASIRVMHLAMAALLLQQSDNPAPGLLDLLRVHLQRISPTIQYAIAQDNNHGTSEAAALFIGGSWLAALGDQRGEKWQRKGRKWLENRSRRLISEDGSFSQYSLNYHRVMLDSYSMAEIWRRKLELPCFSSKLVSRLQAATAWLGNMVSPDGTDSPNLGANDGARLLPLSETDYRDVRPSVQLASVLFSGARAFEQSGLWDQPLKWLKISLPSSSLNYQCSRQYDDGGFAILRDGDAMLLFRYPRFHFRPGQSDLLHVDFWLGPNNLLRDAGSYSYNCEEPWQSYFSGSAAHNTIQFDSRDAMPRLSRFLFGAWPRAKKVESLGVHRDSQNIAAGYRDWKGGSHHRSISLGAKTLIVTDEVKGFDRSAVLRWRLAPGDWEWEDSWLVGHNARIRVETSQPVKRCEVVKGWESRYYSQKTPLPVLEIEVGQAGRLTTELRY